jgi:hypothetical protein
MSVIETLGPFVYHAVGQNRFWIQWDRKIDNNWLQYFVLKIAFDMALVESITLKWRNGFAPSVSKTSDTFNAAWWQDTGYNQYTHISQYTDYIANLRKSVMDRLGWDFYLDRCELANEEDSIALLDELNNVWIQYQLSRDWQ